MSGAIGASATPDPSGATRLRRDERLALALFAAAVATVYFGLFNHDFSVNGLRYADDVERGVELFHPNHLLPNLLYRAVYVIVRFAGGVDWRAIWTMQAVSACAGIVAALAVARVALVRAEWPVALLLGAAYAFGFAAWNFAEEPDVYVLPAAAVATSLAILAPRSRLDGRSVAVLGLLAVFAVLTLQEYVFWYPALLAMVARREASRGHLLALAIGVPLACLATYLLVGALQGRLHGANDVLSWFFGYAWSDQSGLGTYRPAPGLLPRLLGVLLGLGNLAFAYETIQSPAAMATAAVALIALMLLGFRVVAALRRAGPSPRGDAAIILAWCLTNLAFTTWWESRNIEFLFPFWLGAWMLGALAARALDRRVLALTLVLVAGVNLAVAFWPQRQWPSRYVVAADLARHEHLGAQDVLITEELNTIGFLHYFEHVDVRFQPGAISAAMHASTGIADVRRAIDAALASSQRVYTTELDEHGRLGTIARWFAPLGRSGFDGAVERDLDTLYRGLDVSRQPVSGARRVLPESTSQ